MTVSPDTIASYRLRYLMKEPPELKYSTGTVDVPNYGVLDGYVVEFEIAGVSTLKSPVIMEE